MENLTEVWSVDDIIISFDNGCGRYTYSRWSKALGQVRI
ncbi:hypothetical protein C5L23_000181 [Leuconostoc fallax]|uniref:Uncharacterized protein n=1 Tax=Leuconostoc fallax TaxID=1251 RepID=A0A4V3A285_9LACO|nr:hypothetical protein C5L23_000181 [Leuconostoc fallax]